MIKTKKLILTLITSSAFLSVSAFSDTKNAQNKPNAQQQNGVIGVEEAEVVEMGDVEEYDDNGDFVNVEVEKEEVVEVEEYEENGKIEEEVVGEGVEEAEVVEGGNMNTPANMGSN